MELLEYFSSFWGVLWRNMGEWISLRSLKPSAHWLQRFFIVLCWFKKALQLVMHLSMFSHRGGGQVKAIKCMVKIPYLVDWLSHPHPLTNIERLDVLFYLFTLCHVREFSYVWHAGCVHDCKHIYITLSLYKRDIHMTTLSFWYNFILFSRFSK